jgi:hypothetical protein
MAKKPTDYEVGYRKPPAHTRFKKGQSGNPKGRRKGTQNLATDLAEELGERIRVREGDREYWTSKQRAILKALLARASKGDVRAISLLFSIAKAVKSDAAATADEPMTDSEQEIFDRFLARHVASPSKSPKG